MPRGEQMKLGVFFHPTGHHVASWRYPGVQADAGINFAHQVEIAQTAERGKLHMIFFADGVGVREARMEALSRSAQYIANFEPLMLIAALAAVTERIGLVCTASTSYNEPYHIARKFASLDHLSGGRAGWNVVTSGEDSEARNFGRELHYGHAERYQRAREFVGVVKGLWDSWDDDAFIRDTASGVFFDPEGMHTLDHHGKYFSVRGPLNVPRPPQGHPVIVQAGASEDGRAFAAEHAEIIFTNHILVDNARKYYAEVKARVAGFGRAPDHVKIMPGVSATIGATEAEAKAKHEKLQALVHPVVAREMLSTALGRIDLSGYDFDGPLPDLPMRENAGRSTRENLIDLARRENLTIRQLAMRATDARGKSVVVGTPAQVADHLEEWFTTGAADGFNVMPPYLPGAFDDFVNLVVPELQRRGLFRTEYEGKTFRENLGLARPGSRYGTPAAAE